MPTLTTTKEEAQVIKALKKCGYSINEFGNAVKLTFTGRHMSIKVEKIGGTNITRLVIEDISGPSPAEVREKNKLEKLLK